LNEDHIVVADGSREMYKLSTTYIFIGRPSLWWINKQPLWTNLQLGYTYMHQFFCNALPFPS